MIRNKTKLKYSKKTIQILEQSKLDEIYFSSKLTCKEMLDKMPGADKISMKLQLELNKYIDPFTNKVNNQYVKLPL